MRQDSAGDRGLRLTRARVPVARPPEAVLGDVPFAVFDTVAGRGGDRFETGFVGCFAVVGVVAALPDAAAVAAAE